MPHYSQHTNEIMGKLPSRVLRWGMSVVFVIFAGIIAGSCIIKFPQIVTAPISITTINPPFDLIAKTTGRIDTLFCADGQKVNQNDVIAIIHNTANYNDICRVEHLTTNSDSLYTALSGDYRMGDLQIAFSELRGYCADFVHYLSMQDIPRRLTLLQTQIAKHNHYLKQQQRQRSYIEQDLALEHRNVYRDSTLYAETFIAAMEFEKTTQAYIQKKSSLASFDASMTSTELTILQIKQQFAELEMQYNNESAAYRRQINESRSRLQAQIKQWRQTYLLTSSIAGTLSLTKYWSANQNVQNGEKLGAIVPTDSTKVIGIMNVPSAGFGRVAVGQKVNVKLNGYPYFEYGVLKGAISRISSVPDKVTAVDGSVQQCYIVEIEFPDGLQSSYKEQLTLIEQMDGVGEIITRDERLIARFIQPLRALFDKVKP